MTERFQPGDIVECVHDTVNGAPSPTLRAGIRYTVAEDTGIVWIEGMGSWRRSRFRLVSRPNKENSMGERHTPKVEGQVVYVRAVIAKQGDCGQMGVTIQQPGCQATVVVDPKEIRREDRERLGISA